MKYVINCAHRGASGQAPENTLAALERAVALGADMAEIDIQQTADDRLAVFHDDNLDRTSTGTGPLWEKSLAELQSLDAGSWFGPAFAGQMIPSLEEVLEFTRGRLPLNIEMKLHGHERNFADLAISALYDNNIRDHCLLTSFDHDLVDTIGARAPGLITGYIVGRTSPTAPLLERPAPVLSLEKSLVHADLLATAHGAGKQVHVWTVDDPQEMSRLIDLGVDAVITNFPDRFPRSGTPLRRSRGSGRDDAGFPEER